MTALGWIVTAGTIWFCFQFAALLIGWRLAPLRARAVIEWQDCDVKTDWDVHVDTALDILLTHEATPDVDEFGGPERWVALEEEFADLDPLAAQLGERAS